MSEIVMNANLTLKARSSDWHKRRAARFVASSAVDAQDAAVLLSMLGLDPKEAKG